MKKLSLAMLQVMLLALGLGYVLTQGAEAINYQWQWQRVIDYIAFYEDGRWWPAELVEGLVVTVQLSAISLVFTLLIGVITALLRRSHSVVGQVLAKGYVGLIRNTPLLVQIYLLYFVLGPVIGLERFASAVLALALFQGAYTAEIFRAGFNNLAKGQFEAAQSLGLSKYASYRYVILPQVLTKILPPLTNEVVSLVKNSSIVSVMAIFDLTTQGRNIVSETAMPFEIWFTVAAMYLLLTMVLSAIAAWLEHRFGAHRHH